MSRSMINRIAIFTRRVSAMLIAGIWRSRSLAEIEASLANCPQPGRTILVLLPLLALFLFSLLAAQFGWIAMLIFWLGVILLVN